MSKPSYQEQLIEMIRLVGEDLIRHAEEYAGGSDETPTTGFQITITLDPDTDEFNVPEIEIHRTYISDAAAKYKIDSYVNDSITCNDDTCDIKKGE